jgi:hypothetical protein
MRPGSITAASIQVNVNDAGRTYDLEIRVNGSPVATVTLPAGPNAGAHDTTLAVPVVAGDHVQAFMVRTAGGGMSSFTSEHATVEITY